MLTFILGLVIVLALALYFIYSLDSLFGGYDFNTSNKAILSIAEIIHNQGKEDGIFLDLGCATGRLALGVARLCPKLNIRGLDNDRFRVFLAKLNALLLRRPAIFQKGDMFKADVSEADVVYMYLDISLMPELEHKLKHELKPGAIAITNSVQFPFWQQVDVCISHPHKPNKEKLYIYKKV